MSDAIREYLHPRPVYLRLRDVVAADIMDGRYRDGDPLPSVRALAAEHAVNPLTVAKAYQTFQEDGLVEVRRGVGMFVAAGAQGRLRETEKRAFLDQHWPVIAAHVRRLGLNPAELLGDVEPA